MNKFWEIQEGEVDSNAFFKLLIKYFPNATTLFVWGGFYCWRCKKVLHGI